METLNEVHVSLVGNVANDISLRKTNSGVSVCNLRVAVNKTKTKTDWYDVAIFGEDAETVVNTISKGDLISVEGELNNVQYRKDLTRILSIIKDKTPQLEEELNRLATVYQSKIFADPIQDKGITLVHKHIRRENNEN